MHYAYKNKDPHCINYTLQKYVVTLMLTKLILLPPQLGRKVMHSPHIHTYAVLCLLQKYKNNVTQMFSDHSLL